MATSASRYTTPATSQNTDARTSSVSTTNNVGTVSGTSSSQQDSFSNSSSSQTTNSKTNNMSTAAQAALENLLRQLAAGGTPEMLAEKAQRDQVTAQTQTTQSGFTKENAFADAQGLMSQQMRRAMEQMLPSISRAAEDAGSSGGALRALLLQNAADKAAESSSALGVQTATQYGNINANFAQVLEALTRSNPQATEMLVQALGVAKGAQSTTQGTVNTVGSQAGSTTTNGQTSNNTQSTVNESKNSTVDYAPFAVDNTPQFFGVMNQPTVGTGVGSTTDTLAQLAGLKDSWGSYTF